MACPDVEVSPLNLLTNPLLSAVVGLLGVLVGIAIGRQSKAKEMAERERILGELLPATCFVRRQIERGDPTELP